ncbi:hypothetical protein PF010_g24119 [Phytophthora fragariae]|uniref:Uncharacterized protein n=1 Tax=Phytophthora fragariae TaxID=53985 RepID=A0A6A3ICM2_9STRA|nr:hypothetical protein PF011_g23503 [Phytophthora fragariae]KAE9075902.1 hypothetical protein PF010_g24119 [Phytophthora fragariae]KAE9184739.1 hypothetical protein PF004_g23563 [Phytophthora fragariae]KAE9292292.1 hypothetical protein PF008_g25109 [Phytophthora fragariae]
MRTRNACALGMYCIHVFLAKASTRLPYMCSWMPEATILTFVGARHHTCTCKLIVGPADI